MLVPRANYRCMDHAPDAKKPAPSKRCGLHSRSHRRCFTHPNANFAAIPPTALLRFTALLRLLLYSSTTLLPFTAKLRLPLCYVFTAPTTSYCVTALLPFAASLLHCPTT